MLAQGSGAIVNIGSTSGLIVNRPQGQSYYNTSKAAVHQLTNSLAGESAPRGVRVNAVAPTYIRTPIDAFADPTSEIYRRWVDGAPQGRRGEPEEVAGVAAFLASDAASLMTGAIVVADGEIAAGSSARNRTRNYWAPPKSRRASRRSCNRVPVDQVFIVGVRVGEAGGDDAAGRTQHSPDRGLRRMRSSLATWHAGLGRQ